MDGVTASSLREGVVNVFSPANKAGGYSRANPQFERHYFIDDVPPNIEAFNQRAQWFVLKVNDAVVEIIINGTRPNMRHASRTHRVNLDWIFTGVNLDSNISIRYVGTKEHFCVLS